MIYLLRELVQNDEETKKAKTIVMSTNRAIVEIEMASKIKSDEYGIFKEYKEKKDNDDCNTRMVVELGGYISVTVNERYLHYHIDEEETIYF